MKAGVVMKSKEYVVKRLLNVLLELESGSCSDEVEVMLVHQLAAYGEILEEDVPEELWDRIEVFA